MTVGSVITANNKSYEIRILDLVSVALPNIYKIKPHWKYAFVARGKRGGLVSGYITESNTIILD